MRAAIKTEVRNIIRKLSPAQIELDEIKDESMIFDELDFDSVGFIELLSVLEDRFNIHIKQEYLVPEYFENTLKITEFIFKAKSEKDPEKT